MECSRQFSKKDQKRSRSLRSHFRSSPVAPLANCYDSRSHMMATRPGIHSSSQRRLDVRKLAASFEERRPPPCASSSANRSSDPQLRHVLISASSIIGHARRVVKRAAGGTSSLATQQIDALLGACVFIANSSENVCVDSAPLMVPTYLMETAAVNIQSWIRHHRDVGCLGHQVHFAAEATRLAAAGGHVGLQTAKDDFGVHAKAAKLRHNPPVDNAPLSRCLNNLILSTSPTFAPGTWHTQSDEDETCSRTAGVSSWKRAGQRRVSFKDETSPLNPSCLGVRSAAHCRVQGGRHRRIRM